MPPLPSPHPPARPGLAGRGALPELIPLLFALLAMPVPLSAAVWFSGLPWDPPGVVPIIAVVAVAGVGFALAETVGFKVPALPATISPEQARRVSVARFRATLILRFALTELTVLLGVVLAFTQGTLWPYAVGVVLGWPLAAYELLPTRRVLDRLAARLEADGARAHVHEAVTGRPA